MQSSAAGGCRLHVDGYGFAGEGVSDFQRGNGSGLKANVFFRRFIIEIGGIVRRQFFTTRRT